VSPKDEIPTDLKSVCSADLRLTAASAFGHAFVFLKMKVNRFIMRENRSVGILK
jgi:hypothetical protein